jgi:hypothetical protein
MNIGSEPSLTNAHFILLLFYSILYRSEFDDHEGIPMTTRNPYRGLMIKVARTGNNPEQMARAILPARPQHNALTTFGNHLRLVSVGNALQHLEDNWYVLILNEWVIYTFAPQGGVSDPIASEITVKARTSTTPIPWAGEDAKIRALGRNLPAALKSRFH